MAAVGVVLTVAAVATVLKVRRDREWVHGGDGVEVSAQVRATDAAGLPAAVVALGGPSGVDQFLAVGDQALVVRIAWHGPEQHHGDYNVLLLDNRVGPPKPLRQYRAWSTAGQPTFGWDGRFEHLGDHYPWLQRTSQAESGGNVDSVTVPAAADGVLTAVFLLGPGAVPMRNPDHEALVGLFLARGGEPRWAKPIAPGAG